MANSKSVATGGIRPREWWVEPIDEGLCLMTIQGPFSVYRRSRALTGCGWDAQAASTLFPTREVKDILLLGMGGGTVARLCRELHPDARIVAIEAEAQIIDLARRHFGVDRLGIEVVHARAEEYVTSGRGRFDAIVDDAWPFVDAQARAAVQDDTWQAKLARRLRGGGSLAINLMSARENPASRRRAAEQMRQRFVHLREIDFPDRLTTVLVGGDRLRSARSARERMRMAFGSEGVAGMHLRAA